MNAQKQTILRVEPRIIIQKNSYKIGSLNFKLRPGEEEFYYQFDYPEGTKNKFYNYTLQKIMGRLDHITFHKDGTVQLSLKDKKMKHLGINKMPDSTFIPSNSDTITPLLIYSIYQNNGKYYLPLSNNELNNGEDNLWTRSNVWEKSKNFSIILFLTPEKINENDFLNTFWWDSPKGRISGQQLGFPTGRVKAWDGWAVDYVLTDLTLPLPSNIQPDPCYSAFAYDNLHLIFNDFLRQWLNS